MIIVFDMEQQQKFPKGPFPTRTTWAKSIALSVVLTLALLPLQKAPGNPNQNVVSNSATLQDNDLDAKSPCTLSVPRCLSTHPLDSATWEAASQSCCFALKGESVTKQDLNQGDEQFSNVLFSSVIFSISRAGLSARYTRAWLVLELVSSVGFFPCVLEVLD